MTSLALNKLGQLFTQKALHTLSAGVAVSAIMLGGAFAKPASAFTVGGIALDPEAIADQVLGFSGDELDYETSGGTLDDVLLDERVETSVLSTLPGAFVRLGFSNPIFNVAGADLAIFEVGTPGVFRFEINGSQGLGNYETEATGEFINDPLRSINVVRLDLSDFGVAIGNSISEILIRLDTRSPIDGAGPDLALVAGIRSVPEPSAMFGLLATAGILAYQRKLKPSKKA